MKRLRKLLDTVCSAKASTAEKQPARDKLEDAFEKLSRAASMAECPKGKTCQELDSDADLDYAKCALCWVDSVLS